MKLLVLRVLEYFSGENIFVLYQRVVPNQIFRWFKLFRATFALICP